MSFWRDTFPAVTQNLFPHVLDCCAGRLMLRWRGGGAGVTACPLLYDTSGPELRAYKKLVTTVTRRWIGDETESEYFSHDYVSTWEQSGSGYRSSGGAECDEIEFTPPEEPDPEDIPEPNEPDNSFLLEDDEPDHEYSDEVTVSSMMQAAQAGVVMSAWSEWTQVATVRRTAFVVDLEEGQSWEANVSAHASLGGAFSLSGGGGASALRREIEIAVMGGRVAGRLTFNVLTHDIAAAELVSSEPQELIFSYEAGWQHTIGFNLTENHGFSTANVIWEPLR